MKAQFAPTLVSKYNVNGARYTSYPTANIFHDCGPDKYASALTELTPGAPLSLYLHIPFCNTICFYCACNKINTGNHKHAEAYIDRLIQEMALQSQFLNGEHPVEQLHFGGGTPTFLDDDQFRRVFDGLSQHFQLVADPQRDYSIEIDPRALPPSRIQVLAELGFNRMSIGVQDFDPAVQEAVNRIQSQEETQAIAVAARDNGFKSINVDLIYGLPRQTKRGFVRTIERVLSLNPDRISLYNYAHLPERFKTQRQILEKDLPQPKVKLELLENAIEQFNHAGYEYVGMDHFAKPGDSLLAARDAGTLHRNFQGYTTHGHCELMALGVSAISKVGRAYAQNSKTLDEYYAAIDTAQLAIDRGYNLSDDDIVIADVIQRLMCDFYLDVQSFSDQHNIDFWQHFEHAWPQLERMAGDGLVELSAEHIKVTPTGRFLIRNLCMVFDAYLLPQTQGFSKTV